MICSLWRPNRKNIQLQKNTRYTVYPALRSAKRAPASVALTSFSLDSDRRAHALLDPALDRTFVPFLQKMAMSWFWFPMTRCCSSSPVRILTTVLGGAFSREGFSNGIFISIYLSSFAIYFSSLKHIIHNIICRCIRNNEINWIFYFSPDLAGI